MPSGTPVRASNYSVTRQLSLRCHCTIKTARLSASLTYRIRGAMVESGECEWLMDATNRGLGKGIVLTEF